MNLSGYDIFGQTIDDITHLKAIHKYGGNNALQGHLAKRAKLASEQAGTEIKPHEFNVNFSDLANKVQHFDGTSTPMHSVIYNSIEAINSQIKEVFYLNDRFRDIIPIQMDIDPGAASHSYRYIDHTGKAGWVDTRGTAGRSPRLRIDKESTPMRYGGEIVEFTIDDLRRTIFAGLPLRRILIQEGTQDCMNFMEEVCFTGDTSMGWKGFLNQDTGTGDNQIRLTTLTQKFTAAAATGETIRKAIVNLISKMITDSKEIIPNRIRGKLCLVLAPSAYNALDEPLGDNVDKTIADWIGKKNPHYRRTNMELDVKSLQECTGAGAGGKNRGILSVMDKNMHEFPISIMPRALSVQEATFGYQIPIEFKCGQYWQFYNFGMYYLDGTG